MARRPLKPCAWAACSVVVRGETYCDKHKPLAELRDTERIKRTNQNYNERRDDSDAFYKTYRWRKFSELFRKQNPLCKHCNELGKTTPAQLVDHIQPHKTHPDLAFTWTNLRSLCWACHNQIGAKVGLTKNKKAL